MNRFQIIMQSNSKQLLALTLLTAWLGQNASAAPYFTDPFYYSNDFNLGATAGGGAVWTLAGGDVSQIKVTTAAIQTAPDGFASATGLGVAVVPTGTRKATGVPFNGAAGVPAADGNAVYASFLLNVQALPAANLRIAYLHNAAASSAGIEAVVSSTVRLASKRRAAARHSSAAHPWQIPARISL